MTLCRRNDPEAITLLLDHGAPANGTGSIMSPSPVMEAILHFAPEAARAVMAHPSFDIRKNRSIPKDKRLLEIASGGFGGTPMLPSSRLDASVALASSLQLMWLESHVAPSPTKKSKPRSI